MSGIDENRAANRVRIDFTVTSPIVPKTAENFRALSTGEKGLSPLSQVPLYYKNSIVHRAIKGFMVQGGDFTKRNGSGGESIYGGPFPDEDLSQPLDAEGLLVMANKGPNTNGSQWFVTLRACPHLDGKHVVFGRVLKGYDTIAAVADVPTDEKDRPLQPVVIVNCGELVRKAAPPQEPERSRKRSASVSRSASPEERDRRKRSRRSSGPGEGEREDSGDDRKHRKKKHHHHKKHSSKHRHRSASPTRDKKGDERDEPSRAKEPRQETEEEYDARLEREEKERLEASRRYHLSEMKRRYEREQRPSSNGIIYKGRGEMRFRD